MYQVPDGKILVKQTVKSEQTGDYVIDGQCERHCDPSNDAQIAQAIRDALAGNLTP